MKLFCLLVLLSAVLLTGSAFGFEFYRGTLPAELREGRGFLYSSDVDAVVSYARDGDRFIIVVTVGEYSEDFGWDFDFVFYGRTEGNSNQVKLYHLPYGDRVRDGGNGKCWPSADFSDNCTLWFKWNIGRRSQAKGKLATKFSEDALKITFGITGFWFFNGQQKLDFTGTLPRIKELPEHCKELPSPGQGLLSWANQCVDSN